MSAVSMSESDYFEGDSSSSSSSSSDFTGSDFTGPPVEERDEVKEVRRAAAKDTGYVRFWRVAVMIVIIITAVVITVKTYKSLTAEEEDKFERAVSYGLFLLL